MSNCFNQDFGVWIQCVIMIYATIKMFYLHSSLSCTVRSHSHHKFKKLLVFFLPATHSPNHPSFKLKCLRCKIIDCLLEVYESINKMA